jgi:ribosomal protein S18 acetylase RimI-like enzyme
MIDIREASTDAEIAMARALMGEYQAIPGIAECVVGFEEEMAGLPGRYAPPDGILLLAYRGNEAVGCGAFRKNADGIAEMKRLYVRPAARGSGAGRLMVETLIERARERGYRAMRLDTLPFMTKAIAIYRARGFREIERYPGSTHGEALCFELEL